MSAHPPLLDADVSAVPVRLSALDRTSFASVGHAMEDLIVARAILAAG